MNKLKSIEIEGPSLKKEYIVLITQNKKPGFTLSNHTTIMKI